MKRAVLYLSIAIFALVVSAFLSNERNRYSLFGSSGEIRSGEKFGVTVGQNLSQARIALTENGYREALNATQSGNIGYGNLNRIYFLDTGWRRGAVWIVISKDSVAAIGWNYQFGAP